MPDFSPRKMRLCSFRQSAYFAVQAIGIKGPSTSLATWEVSRPKQFSFSEKSLHNYLTPHEHIQRRPQMVLPSASTPQIHHSRCQYCRSRRSNRPQKGSPRCHNLEQVRDIAEVGAGIQMAPNAARAIGKKLWRKRRYWRRIR